MRYEPIAQIGRGGMAEVLLARVHAVGGVRRLAVLKRIWPELATDPDFVSMFLDEARLSLRLNHPNVVQTYEVITGGGELAIAMEYLDGQPLTRVLNRLMRSSGDLSLALRLRILCNVLAGLEHAHTLTDIDGTPLEVVHRDVSPQNVFITYDGQVKLVDFGVAKTLSASHNTRPGTLKGKLAYMAPEQLQRVAIDHRADLFAVGVMLWEMLAGRRMWYRMTEVEIVAHLASGQPLPSLPPDAGRPPGLDAICARALDADPSCRYETAAEMEMDLESMLVGVADSHARNLGKVVSMAFTPERAERQAIIEAFGRPSAPVLSIVPSMPSVASPIVEAPVAVPIADVPSPRASAPVVEAVPASFDASVLFTALEAEPPPVKDVPTVDIDLSGLVSGPIAAPEISRASALLRWSTALLLVGGMIATALYVGNWPEVPEHGRPVAAPAPAPGPAPQPVAAPAETPQETAAEESVRRHRRHRRAFREGATVEATPEAAAKEADTDGTLPLSEEDPTQ
jgi:serine/threonine protein kinase